MGTASSASVETVAKLRQDLRRWSSSDGEAPTPAASTGWPELDALLPDRGVRRGSLLEWIGTPGDAAETVALAVARRLVEDGGALVVVDADQTFYPVAAEALGVDLASLVIVRERDAQRSLWAFREALASPAVSVVWGRVERLPGRAYRQLQLAAEEGGTVGALLRSPPTLKAPAWCDVALRVEPIPVRSRSDLSARIEVVRSRDGNAGRAVEVEVSEGFAQSR